MEHVTTTATDTALDALLLDQESTRLPLKALPRTLKPYADAVGKAPPKYRTVYNRLLDGDIEAEKIGQQWFVQKTDLGKIAEVMGLTATEIKSPKSRKPVRVAA